MEASVLDPGKDVGKEEFQEQLNKWFESRGIIADLRSHLRHLMVTALQNTQIGPKPAERTSPKAQALNLIVGEYLFRHGCHYTLSVFTSEVPTLASFSRINPVLRGQDRSRKRSLENCFQEHEVEEIFNALGMASCREELRRVKESYSRKGNDSSLLELFLQTIIQISSKMEIREALDSLGQQVDEGRRLLSEKWSSRIVDILLAEGLKPPQITAIQQTISRITENELKRIAEEEHRFQMRALAEREKRIQEYLKKHEDEILGRIIEAEKELTTRKDMIDEELSERQSRLAKMAMDWNNKHEEVLRLYRNFHDIQSENTALRKRVEELEEENKSLGAEGEEQNRRIDDLQRKMGDLISRLKEASESNAVLSERIEVLIRRDNKEVSVDHDHGAQKPKEDREEIPLLWSRNRSLDDEPPQRKEATVQHPERSLQIDVAEDSESRKMRLDSSEEEEVSDSLSGSSSSEEIIVNVRKKVQDLEEQTNRINKSYLEYKLRSISLESDSESSHLEEVANTRQEFVIKETKFSQTSPPQKTFPLEEKKDTKVNVTVPIQNPKKTEETSPTMGMRPPTKRQLQNRDFFLQSRQLLQELEKQKVDDLHTTTPSDLEFSRTSNSTEELVGSSKMKKKSVRKSPEEPVLLTPLRTASFYCNEQVDVQKKPNCLALLEETRIKSPLGSARKPLRQQILLAESEEEKNREGATSPKLDSVSSGKMSAGRASGNEGFW